MAGSTTANTLETRSPDDRDRAAVREAVILVARGADLRQWDLVRAAFADTVELDYGTPERLTPDEVVGRWRPLFAEIDATEHRIEDVSVTIDGDRARVTSRFRAAHLLRSAPGGDVWVLEGRYHHELTRTPAGWKVTRMRMVPGESTGNTGLLAFAQARVAARSTSGRRGGLAGGTRANGGADALRARNRETVRAFFRQLEAMDTGEAFAALFADDARQVMPFAPEGFPRLLDGRAAILRQYGGLPQAFESMRFPDLVIRDMASPEECFATYRGAIALKSGGRYDNDYAGHFLVQDGRIVEFHEYFNPIVLQQAFGQQLQGTFNVMR